MHQHLSRRPADRQIDEDVLVDRIVVPHVVRRHLEGPHELARVRITGEDRTRPLVVARPLLGVPRSWIAGAVVDEIELGIVGEPTPDSAGTRLPRLGGPGGDAQIFPTIVRVEGLEAWTDL